MDAIPENYFDAPLTEEEEAALEKFKQFCLEDQTKRTALTEDDIEPFDGPIDPSEDEDWASLSSGYFAALGLKSAQCHKLALLARYTYQYWE